jgi:hypothetical protein
VPTILNLNEICGYVSAEKGGGTAVSKAMSCIVLRVQSEFLHPKFHMLTERVPSQVCSCPLLVLCAREDEVRWFDGMGIQCSV